MASIVVCEWVAWVYGAAKVVRTSFGANEENFQILFAGLPLPPPKRKKSVTFCWLVKSNESDSLWVFPNFYWFSTAAAINPAQLPFCTRPVCPKKMVHEPAVRLHSTTAARATGHNLPSDLHKTDNRESRHLHTSCSTDQFISIHLPKCQAAIRQNVQS